mgnify:CR=1 FL=1|jgi:hypothetical protein
MEELFKIYIRLCYEKRALVHAITFDNIDYTIKDKYCEVKYKGYIVKEDFPIDWWYTDNQAEYIEGTIEVSIWKLFECFYKECYRREVSNDWMIANRDNVRTVPPDLISDEPTLK